MRTPDLDPSVLTVDEVRTIWNLAIEVRAGRRPIDQANAMHELRRVLSRHAKAWRAEK